MDDVKWLALFNVLDIYVYNELFTFCKVFVTYHYNGW